MIAFILACIVSFVPCVALYLWLRNRHGKDDVSFRKLCNRTFLRGVLCVFPIILLSGSSYMILRVTGVHKVNALLYQGLYTFIVLAFMEELSKYLFFRMGLGRTDYPYSWLDVTILMTVVGLGFDVIESITYAIGASIPVVLVRGICIPHAGYGFITGYFHGKALQSGKNGWSVFGFAIAFVLHGLYDFSLSEEFIALNENLVFVAILLALLDIVLVIMLAVFCRRAKKKELYTAPLARPEYMRRRRRRLLPRQNKQQQHGF